MLWFVLGAILVAIGAIAAAVGLGARQLSDVCTGSTSYAVRFTDLAAKLPTGVDAAGLPRSAAAIAASASPT